MEEAELAIKQGRVWFWEMFGSLPSAEQLADLIEFREVEL